MLFSIRHESIFDQEDYYFDDKGNAQVAEINGDEVTELELDLEDAEKVAEWFSFESLPQGQLKTLVLLPSHGTTERWNSLNCSRTAWLNIERALDLPSCIVTEIASTHPTAYSWSSGDRHGLAFGHKAFSIGISCVLVCKAQSAIVLLNSRDQKLIPSLMKRVPLDGDLIPMRVPMLLLDLVLTSYEQTGYEYDMRFVALQESLRTSPWIESHAEESHENLSTMQIALTHLLQQFDGVSQQFALVRDSIEVVLKYHDMLAEDSTTRKVKEHLEYILRRAERLRTVYISQVPQVQANIQTVYSMISQTANMQNYQATQASIEIAQLTRKDSADMRVIAAATLLFLPATFVATLFSTSFFNFQPDNDGSHVSSLYWIYWVVTLTLTALVWAGWSYTTRPTIRKSSSSIKTD